MVLTCENMVREGDIPDTYCFQLKNALAAVGIGAPGSIYPVDNPPGFPKNIDYDQIKIWNWGNPEFYLTYDPAIWETTEDDFLVSKSLPDCHIAANGFRDGGPEGPPPYTYATDTKIMDGIEYFIVTGSERLDALSDRVILIEIVNKGRLDFRIDRKSVV